MSKRNGTNIDLTAKQRKAAEMLANPDFDGTKTDLIEAVGVPRTTFYRWIKDKKFMEYTCKLIEQYTDAELGAVWKALIKRCITGDVQAIKLYFELKGKYQQGMGKAENAAVHKLTEIFGGDDSC